MLAIIKMLKTKYLFDDFQIFCCLQFLKHEGWSQLFWIVFTIAFLSFSLPSSNTLLHCEKQMNKNWCDINFWQKLWLNTKTTSLWGLALQHKYNCKLKEHVQLNFSTCAFRFFTNKKSQLSHVIIGTFCLSNNTFCKQQVLYFVNCW